MVDDGAQHGWRHYHLPGDKLVPFFESRGFRLQEGTTGLLSWPAAWCLAEYGYQNRDLFASKSILEVGSGIGLGGLILAASGSV